MVRTRSLLFAAATLAITGGCSGTPVGAESLRVATPRFETGQTLGSGHRDGSGSTTATASNSAAAADSLIASESGGQTLGSGH